MRVSLLLAAGFGMLLGCETQDRKLASAPKERSQAIQGTPAAASPAPAQAPAHAPAASAARKPRRALCAGQMQEGKGLPKKSISRAAVNGAASLPESLPAGGGAYTWVNFWAAWCVPCKEEIPRLYAWERKLTQQGRRFRLAFISLDDDERQLQQFLGASSDLRASYWLKEGKEREEWLLAAGLEPDPELPIHLLVDPEGRIRCKVQGAVQDTDLPDLIRLLGG